MEHASYGPWWPIKSPLSIPLALFTEEARQRYAGKATYIWATTLRCGGPNFIEMYIYGVHLSLLTDF